jgi:hypothetical protein
MLSVYYGEMKGSIYNTPVYFKNTFRNEWLEDNTVKEMIRDVDNSEVLGSGAINSPVLGVISPYTLSGGVKTLILIFKDPGKIFNASNCGDNCAKWLLKLGESSDITINLRHLMDFGDGDYQIRILNENTIVHNKREMVPIAGKYV